MKQVKIIGYPQPIAKLSKNERIIGGPVPDGFKNHQLEKEIREIIKSKKNKK
ncbi:MAG TPA: hypothetical protein VJY41_05025 [Prolixibacteraceae bacterium]|nr:hypothetical protein [Prolixibacteraceae bacterium]